MTTWARRHGRRPRRFLMWTATAAAAAAAAAERGRLLLREAAAERGALLREAATAVPVATPTTLAPAPRAGHING